MPNMSLKKEQREEIQRYILFQIDKRKKDFMHNTTETFGISETTVRRYIKSLMEDGIIIVSVSNNTGYELTKLHECFIYYPQKKKLEEDLVFEVDILPLIRDLPNNIVKIWAYAYTEIMNNALEHSEGNIICCTFERNAINTSMFITDNGVGIFEKICAYISTVEGYSISHKDAMSRLFTGKLTTNKENHSGEGIFFTSRALDIFHIFSSDLFFTHDSYDFNNAVNVNDIDCNSANILKGQLGTMVKMILSNRSKRELREVFDMFSTVDKGFYKTQIPLKNAIPTGYPVSRSQAKRISIGFEKFEVVELDFENVNDVGQGFADELFRVFQNKHPDIRLSIINANNDVKAMIQRVKNTK